MNGQNGYTETTEEIDLRKKRALVIAKVNAVIDEELRKAQYAPRPPNKATEAANTLRKAVADYTEEVRIRMKEEVKKVEEATGMKAHQEQTLFLTQGFYFSEPQNESNCKHHTPRSSARRTVRMQEREGCQYSQNCTRSPEHRSRRQAEGTPKDIGVPPFLLYHAHALSGR